MKEEQLANIAVGIATNDFNPQLYLASLEEMKIAEQIMQNPTKYIKMLRSEKYSAAINEMEDNHNKQYLSEFISSGKESLTDDILIVMLAEFFYKQDQLGNKFKYLKAKIKKDDIVEIDKLKPGDTYYLFGTIYHFFGSIKGDETVYIVWNWDGYSRRRLYSVIPKLMFEMDLKYATKTKRY